MRLHVPGKVPATASATNPEFYACLGSLGIAKEDAILMPVPTAFMNITLLNSLAKELKS